MTHPTTIVAPWALRRGAPVIVHDCEFARRGTVREVFAGAVTALVWHDDPERHAGVSEIRTSLLALDCLDPVGRFCLRMGLAEGKRCPSVVHPTGTGEFSAFCSCRGTGWLRAPAPHHWIGTAAEGGALTPAHAEAAGMSLDELAAALLVRAAERVVAGLGGIAGVMTRWEIGGDGRPRRRQMLPAAGLGLVVIDTPSPMSDRPPGWAMWDGLRHDTWGGPLRLAEGPETGLDGRRAADACALSRGVALLGDAEGRPLLLPEVTPC